MCVPASGTIKITQNSQINGSYTRICLEFRVGKWRSLITMSHVAYCGSEHMDKVLVHDINVCMHGNVYNIVHIPVHTYTHIYVNTVIFLYE